MAQLKKAAADRKNQRLHEDILEEQGIPEEKEEEATQDQEPSSTVTVFETHTNANNNWERRGSGRGSGLIILERQDAEEDAPRPHNIREMGFSDNFVSKSSPELSHEDVDPVVVVRRRESSGGPSPLKKLKGKRARNIAPTDP